MLNNQQINRLIYALALLRLFIPYLLQDSVYQPHRDEYLYLAEGRHLAWGFMEVPPAMSWLAWIINQLGAGIFWIKFFPSLFGSFTFILMAKMVQRLGGNLFAIIFTFLPFIATGYLRLYFLFHPNFLDVFCWTLAAYALLSFIQSGKNSFLYLFGAGVGFGMLSKYSMAFYALSLLAGIVLTRHRKIFLHKHIYIAGGIALLILSPNLIWQYQHNFPVAAHMEELQEEQLQFIDPVSFVLSQITMLLPCVFIWMAGIAFVILSPAGKPYRVFAWAYVSVITLLIVFHGKDYYAAGAYPVLFALGAVYLEKLTAVRAGFLRYVFIAVPVIFGYMIMRLLMPVSTPDKLAAWYKKRNLDKTGSFTWEDHKNHPLPQDFADMIGWKEVAEKTAVVYNRLPDSTKSKTWIYCRGYFFAGSMQYYGKNLGLPDAVSDNASFLWWIPEHDDVKNIIMIAHNLPENDDIVFRQFEKMTVCDSLTDPYARENGVRIILFENGNDRVNDLIHKSITQMKSRFTR